MKLKSKLNYEVVENFIFEKVNEKNALNIYIFLTKVLKKTITERYF
jgi:hypothetical protein